MPGCLADSKLVLGPKPTAYIIDLYPRCNFTLAPNVHLGDLTSQVGCQTHRLNPSDLKTHASPLCLAEKHGVLISRQVFVDLPTPDQVMGGQFGTNLEPVDKSVQAVYALIKKTVDLTHQACPSMSQTQL